MNKPNTFSKIKENRSNRKSSSSEEVQVFLNEKNNVTFVCPKCRQTTVKNLSAYRNIKKAVKFRCGCSCGYAYIVSLNRRQYFRKSVNLPGQYRFRKDNGAEYKGMIRIADISQGGLQIELNVDPIFKFGDKLIIEFRLDDMARSEITIEAIVRRINGRSIAVEFLSKDHYGRLGGYLL